MNSNLVKKYIESRVEAGIYIISVDEVRKEFDSFSSHNISKGLHSLGQYEIKRYKNYYIFLPTNNVKKFFYEVFLDDLMKKLNFKYCIILSSAVDILTNSNNQNSASKILIKIKGKPRNLLDIVFNNYRIDLIRDENFEVKTQEIDVDGKQLIVSTPEQTLIDIFKYSKYTDPYSNKAQLGLKIIKLVEISKLEGLITPHICQYHVRVLMYFLEENGFEIKHLLYRYDEESKKTALQYAQLPTVGLYSYQ